jgi:phage-related protein
MAKISPAVCRVWSKPVGRPVLASKVTSNDSPPWPKRSAAPPISSNRNLAPVTAGKVGAGDLPDPQQSFALQTQCFRRVDETLTGRTVYANNGIMSPEEKEEQEREEPVKPLFWIASTKDDLRGFPEEVKDVIGFALYQAQKGGKHVAATPLKGFGGAGVLEIVANDNGSTFRGVYTVKFAGAVYALDAFQKKSKKGTKTPQVDIDRIKKRLKAAGEHYKRWRLSRQKKKDQK